MSIETYRDKRTAAAAKYRLECLNAKGEVECSECGMAVPEPRANRNAQELTREKIRKADKGPICNACAASWRYSHHQDAEVEMANSKDEVQQYVRKQYSIEWDGGSDRELLSMLQKNHVSQQAITRIMARAADNAYAKPLANAQTDSITAEDPNLVENSMKDAKRILKEHYGIEWDGKSQSELKTLLQNAKFTDREIRIVMSLASEAIKNACPNLVNGKMRCSCGGTIEKVGDDEYECDDCGQRYERDDWSTGGADNPSKLKAMNNAAFVYVGDEVKVKDDPGLWIVMDFDGGTYTLKGNNGIKKVRAEQIMRNADDFRTSKEKRAAAAEAHRIENTVTHKCEQCGKEFKADDPKQKYCSKECWKDAGAKA